MAGSVSASAKTSSQSSSSTSVDPPILRSRTASIPAFAASLTAAGSLQKRIANVDGLPSHQLTSRGSRRADSATGVPGVACLPLPGAEACKGHASRLTDREKSEIKSFK